MNFKNEVCFVLILLLGVSAKGQLLVEGSWEGALDYNEVTCPIRFDITLNQGEVTMSLTNGVERISHPVQKVGDSLFVTLNPFDAEIKAVLSNGIIHGEWLKPYRDFSAPFTAQPTKARNVEKRNTESLSWELTLQPGTSGSYSGVVKLEVFKSGVTGTILTETGDYRFFEGELKNDSIRMSSFDGAHGFLFIGGKSGNKWSGQIYYEPEFSEDWEAVVNDEAAISDPFGMITVEPRKQTPYYDLLGAGSGKNSVDPRKYLGKVLLIQIFGTWCPNSLDQTEYLLDWYESKPEDVEVLAVTYEPNYSKEYGLKRINDYTEHLSIPYDVVLGGALSKSQAAMPFPFMKKIVAFPTLVMVDKGGYVRYIHSYFNGPATGELFEEFKEEFNEKIDELVNE